MMPLPFHVMAKPTGPICNLDCRYCFYQKEKLYPGVSQWKMPDRVLEQYIRQYIQGQQSPDIYFTWQGGEPTLLGVGFFQRVVEIQNRCAAGKRIHNAVQTNGTLLDDAWGEFLVQQKFLVGLSIDGPRQFHDRWRVDKKGRPTFEAAVRGISVLKKHGVEFSTLSVVGRENSQSPLAVYRFLKQISSGFIQFIPLVERARTVQLMVDGHDLAGPPGSLHDDPAARVTSWSVEPQAYGRFLCDIFDQWVRRDVGRVFVQMFDVALGKWLGKQDGLCLFAETCGRSLAIEHNGDVYSCDHYVYPEFHLGNIMQQPLTQMVWSEKQSEFGRHKSATLPTYCRRCEVRFACNGECPKNRFVHTPDGEPGLNYLCPAYKMFFTHIDPYMKKMAQLRCAGRPAAEIISILKLNQEVGTVKI